MPARCRVGGEANRQAQNSDAHAAAGMSRYRGGANEEAAL
jgi:hypothetical protein